MKNILFGIGKMLVVVVETILIFAFVLMFTNYFISFEFIYLLDGSICFLAFIVILMLMKKIRDLFGEGQLQ